MLGHLVFTGHAAENAAAADIEPRPVRARATTRDRGTPLQSGWISRLVAQLLPRR
jgi:hypothetical protein